MAKTIDSNDQWRALVSMIDNRCGKCGIEKFMDVEVRDNPGEPRGILFRCHGDEEFLEVSDASLRVPKRFRGYMPFTGRLSKKEREKLNEDLRRDADRRTATAKKAAAESEKQRRVLNEQQKRELEALMQKTMQMSVMGDPRWLGIRPICARCERPVDQMIAYEDVNTRNTIFRFQCHGESEDIPVPRDAMRRGDFPRMLQGYRPFTASAGIRQPDKPSQTMRGFVQRLLDDLARGLLSPAQAQELISSSALSRPPTPDVTFTFEPVPISPPKPKPKPIEMIVTSKPRKISLED